MEFHVISKGKAAPPNSTTFPCCTLEADDWDDYKHRILYHLTYYTKTRRKHTIGEIKILHKSNALETPLKRRFSALNEEYCSLGQSVSYYQELSKLSRAVNTAILEGLRDLTHYPQAAGAFSELSGYKNALLRYSEAEKAFREGAAMFNHVALPDAPISFKFTVQLPGAAIPHVLTANLGDQPDIPNRIMVFIGKNGSGKTWMMGRLAASLSGDEVDVGEFEPQRPSFSRIVGMSYSAFDQFNKPENRSFSYRYCGIYDDKGNLTKPEHLYDRARPC